MISKLFSSLRNAVTKRARGSATQHAGKRPRTATLHFETLEQRQLLAADMAEMLGDECLLIEFGSGEATKVRIVLQHLENPAGYIPIDISSSILEESAAVCASFFNAGWSVKMATSEKGICDWRCSTNC